jgi:hypothetical protein
MARTFLGLLLTAGLASCASSSLRLDHNWELFESEAREVREQAELAVARGVANARAAEDDAELARWTMPESSPLAHLAHVEMFAATAYMTGDVEALLRAREALARLEATLAG